MKKGMRGIINTYYHFLKYLGLQNEKIAVLQLTGKIEDFLVKEFVEHLYVLSNKTNFALVNLGNKGEQKIDICAINPQEEIYCMIEAKYLRNVHRIWLDASAADEITTDLGKLKQQLHKFKGNKHGEYVVNLASKNKEIYGLVFASYVSSVIDESKKSEFFNKIKTKANKDFRYNDLQKTQFDSIFDNVKLMVLGNPYYVTLKAGLWRKK